MIKPDDGGCIYPTAPGRHAACVKEEGCRVSDGMSLRDWFAASAIARRLCNAHYKRAMNGRAPGAPAPPTGPSTDPLEIRFWNKVNKAGPCWIWTATVDGNGYGRFRPGGGRPLCQGIQNVLGSF